MYRKGAFLMHSAFSVQSFIIANPDRFQLEDNKNLLDGMVLFCAVVELDSLTAAARRLSHTTSHVSKELTRLEMRLNTKLLNRTTRKIGLTETGRIYYENARRILSDARVIEAKLQTLGDRPYGELKISVPIIFAHGCFSAWVPEFLQAYPDVTLNIDVSDRHVDMIAGGYDLVVRIGQLPDSNLIARDLFQTSIQTVATPEYLAKHGTPKQPSDLSEHDLITFTSHDVANTWVYTKPGRPAVKINAPTKVKCNEAQMERALTLAGRGITRIPEFAYIKELKEGSLVRILADYEDDPLSVHVMYPNREYLPPKTRVMTDFLVQKTKSAFHK